MWGGGFWGTQREEHWRRRKEREEEATLHQELHAKDNVLPLLTHHNIMLSVARQEQIGGDDTMRTINSKKRNTRAAMRSDENQLGPGKKKRRLVTVKKEEESAVKKEENEGGLGKNEYEPEDSRKPPATVKKEEEDETEEKEDGGKLEVVQESRDVKSITPNSSSAQQEAACAIQENLLALSYAMFDTLFGTKNFDPKPFCYFLIRSGERALAEEIALAALELPCGSIVSQVSFVLDELLPL
jgi:hypothetical protein